MSCHGAWAQVEAVIAYAKGKGAERFVTVGCCWGCVADSEQAYMQWCCAEP